MVERDLLKILALEFPSFGLIFIRPLFRQLRDTKPLIQPGVAIDSAVGEVMSRIPQPSSKRASVARDRLKRRRIHQA